jgi:hypothetical protein
MERVLAVGDALLEGSNACWTVMRVPRCGNPLQLGTLMVVHQHQITGLLYEDFAGSFLFLKG